MLKYTRLPVVLQAAIAACTSLLLFDTGMAVERPNFILILSDDQGIGDVAVYGADDIETPNLDHLAESGTRFTHFYANAPVCSPSRSSVLTGMVPQRAGVPGNVPPPPRDDKGLPAGSVTIAELLNDAGYRTAHIGKWHLGHSKGMTPLDQGFDYSFGHVGGAIDNWSHFFYWNGPNRHDLQENGREINRDGEYFLDLMLEKAIGFIDEAGDEPFFIYYAINAPHYPYQGEKKWLDHYRAQRVGYPRDLYNAFVSSMDERIGKLRHHLELRGLTEDTVVIFQSDHGHSTEARAHHGGGSAMGLRGAKFSLFEGGIRVPAMISWPGELGAGEVREQFATGADWLPTIAEMAGVDTHSMDLDGHSLLRIAADARAESAYSDYVWEHDGRWAIREGPWKLLVNPRDTSNGRDSEFLSEEDRHFLVNLQEDPFERENVARRHPRIVERMLDTRDRHAGTYPPDEVKK